MRTALYQKQPPHAKSRRLSLRSGRSPAPSLSRRQRSTAAWSPDSSTAGTAQPRNSAGRVYCGYSRAASEPGRERVAGHAVGVRHGPVDLAHDGVEQHLRRDLAARQHVGADGDAVGDEVRHAFVDALVAPAQHAEIAARQARWRAGRRAAARGASARRPAASRPSRRDRRRTRPRGRRTRRRCAAPCRRRRRRACRRPGRGAAASSRGSPRGSSSTPSSRGAQHVDLLREPREGLGKQGEDVESAPRGAPHARATTRRSRSTSTSSATKRHQRPRAVGCVAPG